MHFTPGRIYDSERSSITDDTLLCNAQDLTAPAVASVRIPPSRPPSILTAVTDIVGFFSFLGIATLLASTL